MLKIYLIVLKRFELKSLLLIAALSWVACAPKTYTLQQYEPHLLTISDTIVAEPKMSNFILGYKGRLDSVMNEIVGTTEVPLSKAQPESTMGNFAADAQLEAGKKLDNLSTISVVNYGCIRIPFVAKGNITKGKIYEIMPFDNMVTIIEIPGAVLQTFCDHMAARKGWPVSGLSYVIKDGKATDVKVGSVAIKDNAVYKLVTSDYIANGGDECEFLVPLKKYPSTVFLRDAMIDKVRRDSQGGKGLHPKLENRVTYAE